MDHGQFLQGMDDARKRIIAVSARLPKSFGADIDAMMMDTKDARLDRQFGELQQLKAMATLLETIVESEKDAKKSSKEETRDRERAETQIKALTDDFEASKQEVAALKDRIAMLSAQLKSAQASAQATVDAKEKEAVNLTQQVRQPGGFQTGKKE